MNSYVFGHIEARKGAYQRGLHRKKIELRVSRKNNVRGMKHYGRTLNMEKTNKTETQGYVFFFQAGGAVGVSELDDAAGGSIAMASRSAVGVPSFDASVVLRCAVG